MSKYKTLFLGLFFSLTCSFGGIEAVATSITTRTAIVQESHVELYHSQDRKLLGDSIKESIREARESILIFSFSLSDPEVIVALNERAAAGLKVTVVVDTEHLGDIKSKRNPNIEIVTRTTGEGHLHHKILVVDQKEIWVGSANFTTSAYQTQENLMMRFVSAELGHYLHNEADVFRGKAKRSEHSPLVISLRDQEVHFCLLPHDGFPPKKIEKAINDLSKTFLLKTIQQAKTNLKIAMMVWTNNDLAAAVIQAYQRGIKVQVVAPDLGGNLPMLISAGIEVKVNPKLQFMHNKMMCVDDNILVNGSANWSQSSFTRSDESFVVVKPMAPEQVEIFTTYWNYLFPGR